MGSQDVVNFIRERLITMKKQADNDLIAMKGEEQLKLSVICEEVCSSYSTTISYLRCCDITSFSDLIGRISVWLTHLLAE